MITSHTNSLLDRLKDRVVERRPILGEIVSKYGDMSIYDYAKRYYRKPDYPINQPRINEFLQGFREEVSSHFGEEIADSCSNQVKKSYHLSNIDHHGPIGLSRQTNNILISIVPLQESSLTDFPNNICVACSKISFNNWSYPRGFEFHSYSNKGFSNNSLTFFGHAVDKLPVYNHKGFNLDSLTLMRKSLYTLWNEKYIWRKEFNKLNQIIDEVFIDQAVLAEQIYTNQVAKINYMVWKKISEALGQETQNLIYIEQERLINRLLIEFHLNQDTTIHKIIFDSEYQDLMTKYFDGIICGFSEKTKYGTFLFWAIPKGGKNRIQLWKRADKLVSNDGNYQISLTPEAIHQGIMSGELMPSTLLSFIIFSFYYPVRQIGGLNQTTYLTQMKEGYIKLLADIGDAESIRFAQVVPTTDLITINSPLLAFMKGPNNELIPATPLDLYLYGKTDTLEIVTKVAKNITLGESIMRSLPAGYTLAYLESEREDDLSKIDEKYIDSVIGFEKKIIPFATIGDSAVLQK